MDVFASIEEELKKVSLKSISKSVKSYEKDVANGKQNEALRRLLKHPIKTYSASKKLFQQQKAAKKWAPTNPSIVFTTENKATPSKIDISRTRSLYRGLKRKENLKSLFQIDAPSNAFKTQINPRMPSTLHEPSRHYEMKESQRTFPKADRFPKLKKCSSETDALGPEWELARMKHSWIACGFPKSNQPRFMEKMDNNESFHRLTYQDVPLNQFQSSTSEFSIPKASSGRSSRSAPTTTGRKRGSSYAKSLEKQSGRPKLVPLIDLHRNGT
eukprot:TRINITY_DN134140_c0_g1_i1.p1 TRINITY_DN134140_c0_g1~~TRINITY_DN134140_c0_g1_i1.p1  ORF type:complete len:271 (+),score=54.22 TRINITY_DN134140_c0_g1_i1:184-996(+)